MTRLKPVEIEVTDDFGEVRDRYTSTEEEERLTVVRDGPSMMVRDVRDFFWPESAKSVDDAAWIIDRTWTPTTSCTRRRRAGFYKQLRGAEGGAELAGGARTTPSASSCCGRSERNKDLIEVLEYWTDDRVITVGGRKVVLDSRPNPFRIKRKPFVVCSGLPDAFQMVGHLGGRVARPAAGVPVDDPEPADRRAAAADERRSRSSAPTWTTPTRLSSTPALSGSWRTPSQVDQLQIDPTAAQITLEAESLIKGDLQNMMGGLPFAGGAESVVQGAGGSTATGMSIITSIAQKHDPGPQAALHVGRSARSGELFLGMMGQMLREERTISQIGPGGAQQLLQVHPLDLQGEFNVNIDVMDESTVRQEKRSRGDGADEPRRHRRARDGDGHAAVMEKVLEATGSRTSSSSSRPSQPPTGQPPPRTGPRRGRRGCRRSMAGAGPVGSQGQTNPALAAAMGGGRGRRPLDVA